MSFMSEDVSDGVRIQCLIFHGTLSVLRVHGAYYLPNEITEYGT